MIIEAVVQMVRNKNYFTNKILLRDLIFKMTYNVTECKYFVISRGKFDKESAIKAVSKNNFLKCIFHVFSHIIIDNVKQKLTTCYMYLATQNYYNAPPCLD